MKQLIIITIQQYQKFLSPDHSFWAKKNVPFCKHYPTCSEYMIQSIKKKGIIKGGYAGVKRILRCMPWSKPSYDPVESQATQAFKKK